MLKGELRKSRVAALLCFVLLVVLALGGCGSSNLSDEAAEEMGINGAAEYDQSTNDSGYGLSESGSPAETEEMRGDLPPRPFVQGENVKLIYSASINLQTVDFEKAELQFINMVKANGGYFESSYVDRGSYYSEGNHIYGSYIVRIPQNNYEAFLSSVSETSHVVSINKNVTDIGMEYFDTETRLNTLRAKADRLTELLKDATNMSDIISIESEIADTQYEIDMYTSTLNRYDSLIDYTTVSVSMEQVERLGSGIDEEEGFFASFIRNIVNGLNNFVDNTKNLFMWIAYNLVGIVVAVAVLIVLKKWYEKRVALKGSLISGEYIKKVVEKVGRKEKK